MWPHREIFTLPLFSTISTSQSRPHINLRARAVSTVANLIGLQYNNSSLAHSPTPRPGDSHHQRFQQNDGLTSSFGTVLNPVVSTFGNYSYIPNNMFAFIRVGQTPTTASDHDHPYQEQVGSCPNHSGGVTLNGGNANQQVWKESMA